MTCTIFENFGDVNNPHYIPLSKALERIKTGKSKDKILEIRRKLAAGEDYEDDKKSLPCIMFSVAKTKMTISKRDIETHREDASVVEHSGVFTLDWDKCEVSQKIEQLKRDPYIHAIWISVTGTGVRALVKCPANISNHNLYYTAFLDRYPELDSTSRNISRVTFESWDENLWVNPNSLVWDKKLTEDERRSNKEKEANKRGKSVLSTAVAMVRSSYDGNKHETLLKAANLVGGYISAGRVKEEDAIKILEEEIRAKNPKDMRQAVQTIKDGIEYGKKRPLAEAKKIEKAQSFLKREDGTYDFEASNEEMTEYELAVINGVLEMGLVTGMNELNKYWMFKKHHLVWFIGADSVGKSFLVWYLSVLTAKLHGWKIIIHSAENKDGQLRKKLKEYYLGKSIKLMDDEELTIADGFVKDHFRIISSKQMHTLEEFLLKCEIIIDEGFEADVVIGEPWNSFDMSNNADSYRSLIHSLNILRVFKENYCSVWVCDHINTSAARSKDKDGYVLAPSKADAEMGQMKANKVDDFIIIHRIGNHPFKKKETQIHVQKVKDEETGGGKTEKDSPVILELEDDYCGYKCNGINPIKYKRI
jgi:hypothetical protein